MTTSKLSHDLSKENISDDYKEIIKLPYKHITQKSGKKIRTKLIRAFNNWLNVSKEKVELVTDIIEMLHNISLIIDDVEDNSTTRRGIPAAHIVYGINDCINCSTSTLVSVIDLFKELFTSDKVIEALQLFWEFCLEIHIGQGLDIYWRDNGKCPTEREYLYMVEKKTGAIFELGVRILQMLSENKTDYMPLVKYLSHLFQIRDDYANLKLDEYTESKGFAEDITEGKFSFPIIHAINNNGEDIEILSILKQRTTNVDLKKYLISLLEENGSLAYTYQTIVKLDNECRKMVNQFGNNPDIIKYLDKLTVKNFCSEFRRFSV